MRLSIEDQTYFVMFEIQNHQPPITIDALYSYAHGKRKGQPKKLLVTHTTLCIIKQTPTTEKPDSKIAKNIASGEAWCSAKDWFDIHEGRREALRRALEELKEKTEFYNFPVELVWKAFVKTLPKTPPSAKQLRREIRLLNAQIAELTKKAEQALV